MRITGDSHEANLLQQTIKNELVCRGLADETSLLAEFIVLMLSNDRSAASIATELTNLLGDFDVNSLMSWVYERVKDGYVRKRSLDKMDPPITAASRTKEEKADVLHKTRHARLKEGPPPRRDSKSLFERIDAAPAFRTSKTALCRYNDKCRKSDCTFAHSSPAVKGNPWGLVLSEESCKYGRGCDDANCVLVHPSPTTDNSFNPSTDIICGQFPECHYPNCRFMHPHKCNTGVSCETKDCTYWHPTACKFNPCLKPSCSFAHAPYQMQRRNASATKTWNRKFVVDGAVESLKSNSEGTTTKEEEIASANTSNKTASI